MATPYSKIYNSFLGKITDYDLPSLSAEFKDLFMLGLLTSAIPKFKVCIEDLSDRSDTTLEFTDDLSDESVDILSELMVVEWLQPQLYKSDFFQNQLGIKDSPLFSRANLLKEVRQTYFLAKQNAKIMMINYSYYN